MAGGVTKPPPVLQDKFFTQLRNSADGFNVIAEFFGRGLLNNAHARRSDI